MEGNRSNKKRANETKETKSMMQPSEIISDRTVPIKNKIAEQEQSSRQNSVELLGLPNNISNGDFEEVVLQNIRRGGDQSHEKKFSCNALIMKQKSG